MEKRQPIFLWVALLAALLWGSCMVLESHELSLPTRPDSCRYFSGQSLVDLELASSPTCFNELLAQGSLVENARIVRVNTCMDFVFIGLYWSVFVLFAKVFQRWLSKWVVLLISIAALFDMLENVRLLQGVGATLGPSSVYASTPWPFSMAKWVIFSLALIALGVLLWTLADRWSRAVSVSVFSSAMLTLLGLYAGELMKYATWFFVFAFAVAIVRYCPWRPSADGVVVLIEYAYLMRFQIVAAAILVLGLPVAYWAVPSVFEGLFDARGIRSYSLISWAALQLAWTIMVTCRLVLAYGPERFGRAERIDLQSPGLQTVSVFAVLAVPSIAALWCGTSKLGTIEKMLGTAAGALLAVIVLMVTAALHFAIEEGPGTTADTVFPSFGFLSHPKINATQSDFWRRVDTLLCKLPEDWRVGIVKNGSLRSGHEMAMIAVAILLVSYGLAGIAFSPAWTSPEQQPAALFFLLFLITLLTWMLSGAAFFLDRFRLPVFATLLVVSLLTGVVRTDHEFDIKQREGERAGDLPAARVVEEWRRGLRRNGNDTVTVVATAGGGIRAAAWTAEVLTGLEQDCGEKLSSSMLLVSSVSGGSVGAMFAVAPYSSDDGSFANDEKKLNEIRFNAVRSSLSAVGWGMLYPDLARTTPLLGIAVSETFDRGWSLENAWATGWKGSLGGTPWMQNWRLDVARGRRPAVIFNATAAESGQRFLIGSTEVSGVGAVQFFKEFGNWDIRVPTAARLSATFPYVTPEARPSKGPNTKRYHVADGGFYDNSGLLSAIEWLEDAKKELAPFKILLIVIDARPGTPNRPTSWSWQKQSIGPLETLLNVRTSSQEIRDDFELQMAIDNLDAKDVRIERAAKFLYESDLPLPLSWHLTDEQLNSIHEQWTRHQQDAKQIVYKKLGCTSALAQVQGTNP
jgi:hypothetical protein